MLNTQINELKPLSYERDNQSQILIGGLKIQDLAKEFGTPLYVLCGETIRKRMRAYKETFAKANVPALVLYASKALNCKGLCRIANEEGLGIDVVSAGELYTALQAGMPPEKIILHGNNKSHEEITMAVENEIASIVIDNFRDIELLTDTLKTHSNKTIGLLIRITPGIECHTHEYIKTGSVDSKFGFNLYDLDQAIQKLLELQKQYPQIQLRGLHAHIGSQIFETEPHVDTVAVLMKLYQEIKNKYDLSFTDINIGGGLGIKYQDSDDPPEIELWTSKIINAVIKHSQELDLTLPRILIEPGRSIVGSAGLTIYEVGNIKDIQGIRKYVSVNGGMGDNSRPIMYQAIYTAEVNGKESKNLEKITLAGKYCESGDILIKDIELPPLKTGDLIVVFSTGAYNYSMSSNYNRNPRPALILVENSQAQVLVKRETLEDLLRLDQ